MRDAENLKRLRREWYYRNKESESEKARIRKQERTERIKQYIIGIKDSSTCKDCGLSYPHYVMDFDHRDPKDKGFTISRHNGSVKMDRIIAEIAKCDIVCANCHRERTYGGRSIG